MLSFIKDSALEAILVNTWDNVRYISDTRPVILIEWYVEGHFCVLTPANEPSVLGYSIGENLPARFIDEPLFPFFSPVVFSDKWADRMSAMLKEQGVKSGRVGVDMLPYSLEK